MAKDLHRSILEIFGKVELYHLIQILVDTSEEIGS